ncbi:uncharacterized protein EAE98_002177 [Botrytis deweyae]|uniref:Tat pathway signal sequence n=1 Tax=Botrytis deweyae TaxID=2478750 RepID=A0ABQ7IWG5_9HELO|nr:uncharacterized protein EAE98_002177 [Botrytis deweyae]KAF7935957.1 hypothetical protein EAE98_002177 [Botrytis deweyae]
MRFTTLVEPLYKMIPAADIETLPSPEVLYHRRSSEVWSDSYHDPKKEGRESSEGLLSKTHSLAPSKTRFFFKNLLGISVLFLIILNALQLILILSTSSRSLENCLASPGHNHADIPELSLERSQTRRIARTSPFTSRNATDGNEAWHNILPGHGVVALPASYVKKNNIPESTATHLYSGDTEPKHIYFIESYHVLHCLRMLRSLYHSMDYGLPKEPYLPPLGHPYHCFDRIRQFIMCNPDYTLVPNIAGHDKSDFTQPNKKCLDWDALRDWAEKYHGNYMDDFAVSAKEKEEMGYDEVNIYNNYKKGDGLPVGQL